MKCGSSVSGLPRAFLAEFVVYGMKDVVADPVPSLYGYKYHLFCVRVARGGSRQMAIVL